MSKIQKQRKLFVVLLLVTLISIPTTHAQTNQQNSLSIAFMRQQNYPGSDLTIEQTLTPGINYNQYIASYLSDGFKIYGLLTVPQGPKPENGWPVIIFYHGYIRPNLYKTTEHYELYVDAFATKGYIVFRPDLRGNGDSQGLPDSQYFSPAYSIDGLNALETMKKYPDANPNKIGTWGHSDGGNLILRNLVVNTKDIKAAVIWGGVVAPYSDLTKNWQNLVTYHQTVEDLNIENNHMQDLLSTYGTPENNPAFWNSIDPFNFLNDINTPILLQSGGADEQVPPIFSARLRAKLGALGKPSLYYYSQGLNHNISIENTPRRTVPYPPAINRALNFFNKYLK